MAGQTVTRAKLAELLNEDLAREYQAIIAYVVYSQVLTGAEYMSIAAQLEEHAHQELQHALTLSRQIDYLGKMPTVTPKQVKVSKKARDMLRFDLQMRPTPSATTGNASANARRSANLRWRNSFGKFSCRSRTI